LTNATEDVVNDDAARLFDGEEFVERVVCQTLKRTALSAFSAKIETSAGTIQTLMANTNDGKVAAVAYHAMMNGILRRWNFEELMVRLVRSQDSWSRKAWCAEVIVWARHTLVANAPHRLETPVAADSRMNDIRMSRGRGRCVDILR